MNGGGFELAGRPVTVMGLGLFGGGVESARWLAASPALLPPLSPRRAGPRKSCRRTVTSM